MTKTSPNFTALERDTLYRVLEQLNWRQEKSLHTVLMEDTWQDTPEPAP